MRSPISAHPPVVLENCLSPLGFAWLFPLSPFTHILESVQKQPKDQLCQQNFQAQSPISSLAQSHSLERQTAL